MNVLVFLIALLISVPAWAEASSKGPVTLAQAKKLDARIVKRQNAKAAKWLDAHVGGLWCDALELSDDAKPRFEAALRANIGVLARRTKRWDDAMSCLTFALEREPSRERAAALYETYLVIRRLSTKQRAVWAERWKDDETEDYPSFDDPDDACPALAPTLKSEISCEVLWRGRTSSSREFKKLTTPLLDWAYRLAPLPAYARGEPEASDTTPLRSVSFEALSDSASATEAASDSSERPNRHKLGGGTVELLEYTTPRSSDDDEDEDDRGCHDTQSASIHWETSAGTQVLDLGELHFGDNCYVEASTGEVSLEILDKTKNLVRVTAIQSERSVGSHFDPIYTDDDQRTYVCDLSGPDPTCLVHHMSNHMGSDRLYSHAPRLGLNKDGKLVLEKRPGDYHDPKYDALEGKTVKQAARMLLTL